MWWAVHPTQLFHITQEYAHYSIPRNCEVGGWEVVIFLVLHICDEREGVKGWHVFYFWNHRAPVVPSLATGEEELERNTFPPKAYLLILWVCENSGHVDSVSSYLEEGWADLSASPHRHQQTLKLRQREKLYIFFVPLRENECEEKEKKRFS